MALSSYFLNPAGLATAVVLIPFLLLYLIKPKPKHETIPSLLFIMKDVGKSNINNFFRNWLKDLLFLLHLLLLLVLIAAVAKPYINVPRTFLADQTVILIDTSASMQAGDRFDQAVTLAEDNLGKENTIITITEAPTIVVERVSSGRAKEALRTLEPTDTATSISDALGLASGFAGAGTRVVVLSDFVATAGDRDYDTSADLLEASGAEVEYLPITSAAKNVGIIDLAVGPSSSSLWVKNFNTRPEEITLTISDADQSVLLAPGESKEISFNTPAGVAEITIKEDDDLLADNTIYTSAPDKNTIKLLIITNNEAKVRSSNFLIALNVIQENFPTTFEIDYAVPPKIPRLDHDVYVVYEATYDFILPGYVKTIKEQIENGGALIVFSQAGLFGLDWQGLLPVAPVEESQGARTGLTGGEGTLVENVEFGQVSSYLRVAADEEVRVLAWADDDPVIVMDSVGKGTVLYYGIDELKASFTRDPTYPVYWRRIFDQLTHRPSVENLNVRTGTLFSFPKDTKVKTPSGTITSSLIPVEHAGLYTLPDRTIAANLLSDAESALNFDGNLSKMNGHGDDEGTEKVPKDLSRHALWAAFILLLFEILYVKYRGDF